MATTTLPLLLATRPAKEQDAGALPDLIRRINTDRGHLRNVTEDSLRQEIERQERGDATDDSDGDEQPSAPGDVEAQQKQLLEAREAMLDHIKQAEEQAMLALDFTSFLMKKDAPRQAEQSMSPVLKQMMPVGNLALDKLATPQPSTAEVNDDNLTATGWSLQALNTSADSILQSATKLEQEVRKETNYWNDVLSVRDNGWSVCRVPRQQRGPLAVRYGFLEATPVFQSQSMAVMRPDSEGHVTLDAGIARDPKVLRVRILRNGAVTQDSYSMTTPPARDDISAKIQQARDSLFEEELFYELGRESRNLLNYGVRSVGNSIIVPLSPDLESGAATVANTSYQAQLSLQPLRQPSTAAGLDSMDIDTPHEPAAIATSLRLLLMFTYRNRFRERRRPPPPMSMEKQPLKTTNILRTFLTIIRHRSATSEVSTFLKSSGEILQMAGLASSFSAKGQDEHTLARNAAPMDELSALVSNPWHVTHILSLPNAQHLKLRVSTSLNAPTFGSRFHVHTGSATSESSESMLDQTFTSPSEAIACASLSIRTALLEHVKTLAARKVSSARETAPGLSEVSIKTAKSKTTRLILGLGLKGNSLLVASAPGATTNGEDKPAGQVRKCTWLQGKTAPKTFEEAVKDVLADT